MSVIPEAIFGAFATPRLAEQAVKDLLAAGFLADDVTIAGLAFGPITIARAEALGGGVPGGLEGFFAARGAPETDAVWYAERVRAGAYVVVLRDCSHPMQFSGSPGPRAAQPRPRPAGCP